jgi:plasmid stabilization system protein ParE
MNKLKVVWSIKAKDQLKVVFEFYKPISFKVANSIKNNILKAANDLVFAEQFEKDEIEPEFRRILISHYKLIYTIDGDTIFILAIFDTRQAPNNQIK